MKRAQLAQRLLAPTLLAVACGQSEPPQHVRWPADTLPFALLLELDARGARVVRGPFRAPAETVVWSELDDTDLVLAGLSEDALRSLHPRVDLGAPEAAFRLSTEPEDCAGGRAPSDDRRTFGLPAAELSLWTLHGSTTEPELERLRRISSGWSLEVPLERESCAHEWSAAPFGEAVEVIAPGAVLDGRERDPANVADQVPFFELRSAAWISEDAVMLATWEWLFWLERGGRVTEASDRMRPCAGLAPAAPGGTGWSCWSLGQRPGTEDVLVVGLSEHEPRRAAVVFLDVGEQRFQVLSSSIAEGRHLNVVSIDEAGHMLVGAREGWVGFGTLQDGLLGWARLPNEVTSVDHLLPLPGPTGRFLVATSGGSAYRVEWPDIDGAQTVSLPGDPTSANALARLPDDEAPRFLFLRSFVDPLHSDDTERWTARRMEVPAEAARCARAPDTCGYRSFSDLVDVAGPLDAESFLVAPRHCSSLFRYDPGRSCLVPILPPDRVSIEGMPPERWRGTRRRGERVLAYGDGARVVELTR